jgi:Ethanolamine utilization protein EutJ (predicted chaperonin)
VVVLPPEAVAEVLSALDEDAVVVAGGGLAGVDVLEEQGPP